MSAFGGKADIGQRWVNVRLWPKADIRLQSLTWIKFRVVAPELSFNDGLAFCETGARHSRAPNYCCCRLTR